MRIGHKLILCLFVICIPFISNAQKLCIKAGYNLSTVRSDFADLYPTSGFHTGATVDFSLGNTFSIEPGLLLTSKGFSTHFELADDNGDPTGIVALTKINLLYIETPITVKATYDIGKCKIYWNMGPYLAMGIDGRISNRFATHKIQWGSNSVQPKFDYGLTSGVGIVIKSFDIGLVCDYGLIRLFRPTAFSDNRSFGLSVGYRFGKK